MLELGDVHVHYGKVEALKGITVSVQQGEIVTLIGANGAGKTTTLKTISGVRPVSSGVMTFEGEDITGRKPHQLVEMGICQAPEGRGIFPGMSVMENLEMGAYANRGKDAKSELDRVFALFPRLQERSSQPGGTLSGGEQQMLAIGRALMAKLKLLLLDEPSLGLAPLVVKQIFDAIRMLNAETGLTVLLVEQNANQALRLAHRGYVLVNGRITMEGPGRALLARPEIRDAYLGGGHG